MRTCRDGEKIVGAVADQAQSIPPVVAGSSRTVRLFGVNLECHGDAVEPPPRPDGYNGQHIYYYSTPHPMVNNFFTFLSDSNFC